MIVLLGVGHVFDISTQVRSIIEAERPDIVCIELDPPRYQALINPPNGRIDAPLPYRLLSVFQKRIAKSYGSEAGAEMLAAVNAAHDIGAEVLMIDVDASHMFHRLWSKMSSSEKIRLIFSAISSLFLSRRTIEAELSNYQADEDRYMKEMAQQFPTMKQVLIDERNTHMAKHINAAASRVPLVLAVIGDGHVEGIVRLLDRDDVQVIRLKELMGGQVEGGGNNGDNSQAKFHYQYLASVL
ncbi:MAG: hypothetical protein GX369_03215 [Euryarchaeota archaeon]|nr:hypothetical protein [Euryarchaeota archaeon]